MNFIPTTTTKNGCNDGLYISESAPYDNDVLQPGKTFEKSWKIKNLGTCTWDEGYTFAFLPVLSTEGFQGSDIVIKKPEDFIEPGKSVTFIRQLVTNNKPGTYQLGNYETIKVILSGLWSLLYTSSNNRQVD